MNKSTRGSSYLIDFGPRVRGSTIMRAATAIGIIAILLGYVIPLLSIDLLEYSHVDLLGIILGPMFYLLTGSSL
jgi:hypothetical protein